MVNADYLFLMTDVDCLYDKNPRTHPDAMPIEVVDDISALEVDGTLNLNPVHQVIIHADVRTVSSAGSSLGTGGMSTKLTAARLATSAGVTTVITSSANPSKIFDIVDYVQSIKADSGSVTPQTPRNGSAQDMHPQCLAATLRCSNQAPDASEIARQHELICTGANGVCGVTKPNGYIRTNSNGAASSPASRHHSRSGTPLPTNPPPLHTRFTAKPRAIRDRYFWILHGLKPHGTIVIDEGAYKALTRSDKAGLLPVGVVDITGHFSQQECVSIDVCRKDAETKEYKIVLEDVGRALVNYTSSEIVRIRGRRSGQIQKLLGYAGKLSALFPINLQ